MGDALLAENGRPAYIHGQAPAKALDSLKQATAIPIAFFAFNHPVHRLFEIATKRPAHLIEQLWSIRMSSYVRSAAYAASQVLAAQGLTVKRSHLSEVIAALLGYRTHAALAVEETDVSLDYHLDDAEVLVLNQTMGEARAEQLGLPAAGVAVPDVMTACIDALKAHAGSVGVYVSVADFYESHASQALAEAIYNDDDVAGAMAESNASFPDEPEMDIECPSTTDLWAAVSEWAIEADGVMTGEYDLEGDRMFNGDTLNCRGRLLYSKAGRAGLVLIEASGMAGADDSWRDLDREDELAYLQSLERPATL
ncbi:hypothetical protein [Pseudomonas lopnurensis]|uniref:hypothetical protein n=1 Tax=Pseudomonas lopnurensis TaxID=1477517 RepID=UPI0028ABACB8|nr:hypothetical protein [Pseudomonas lopnurensis]